MQDRNSDVGRRARAEGGQGSDGKPSFTPPADPEPKALAESEMESISEPGGFKNDPDDPTNPNEAIERHRRKLRPNT